MKKTSQIIKEKTSYDIKLLIDDTALIYSSNGTSALLNIKTNKLITELNDYYTISDSSNKLYFQRIDNNYIIYDALNNKMVANNYELIEGTTHEAAQIYKSIDTGKYHIFNSLNFRTKGNIFDIPFDDAKKINDYIYILTKDGKKALYDRTQKEKPNFIYDSIEIKNNVILLIKDGKKYINNTLRRGEYGPFDDVIIKDELVYCKKNNTMEIYKDNNLLLSYDNADDINLLAITSCSYSYYQKYLFEIDNNGKKTVVACNHTDDGYKSKVVKGTEGADEVIVSRNIHLRFGKKYKFLRCSYGSQYVTEKKYKGIEYLGDGLYLFSKGKKSDLYLEKRGIIIENITSLELVTEAGIEFIINNKKHLCAFYRHHNEVDNIKIYDNYDGYEYLGNGIYKTIKNNKIGLIINGKERLKPDYKDVEIKPLHRNDDVLILLEKFDNKYEFGKYCDCFDYYKTKYDNLSSIDFLKDIIVLKDDNDTYIIDYNEKLLNTFSKDTCVSEVDAKEDDYQKSLYKVNNDTYFYMDNKFEKAMMYERDKYITDYEDDEKNIIRIETTNKKLHDKLCNIIEETDLQGQAIVDKIYSDSVCMRVNHKNVVKLIKKNDKK